MRYFYCATLLAILALCGPAQAAGVVRTLFVGIDHYAYMDKPYIDQPGHDPDFKNLQGAVADVKLIKGALTKAFNTLKVDNRDGGLCGAPADYAAGALSVTLLNACATRKNILDAFTGAVAASRAGDKVLFYYAGHGSQIDDDAGIEYNGKNDTIVQADARLGPGAYYHDILGVELRAIIDGAPRGVKVVTIFDSCNSGKATRDLKPRRPAQARLAPPVPASITRPTVAGLTNTTDRVGDVHLAAAADGVAANEMEIGALNDHVRHGVFTYALKVALENAARTGIETVSYADIFTAASQTVADLGFGTQQPQAAGDLHDTFLGQAAVSTRVEPVSRTAKGGLTLGAGALSGVTAGSVYGVFATSGAAGGAGAPTVRAVVADGVGEFSANLTPSGPVPAWSALWAREITHKFALRAVSYRIEPGVHRAAEISAALAGVDAFSQSAATAAYSFGRTPNGDIQMFEASGAAVGEAINGAEGADDFKTHIAATAKLIARYHEVLDLGKSGGDTPPKLWIGRPGEEQKGPPTTNARGFAATPYKVIPLVPACKPIFALINTATAPRYLYLIDFEVDRSISVIYPPKGLKDQVAPGAAFYVESKYLRAPNSLSRSQLMLLSTAQSIDATAFEQSADTTSRAIGAPSLLERLLRRAAGGSRGLGETVTAPDWGASMATLDFTPAPAGADGQTCPPPP